MANFRQLGARITGGQYWLLPILFCVPPLLGFALLHAWDWDFSIPLVYDGVRGADEIWQLICTKTLLDTGWILQNPYLGAPGISQWYNNSGAQTSALHSVLMLLISTIVKDAISVQQIYFFLNFSLITSSAFLACRLLYVKRVPAYCIGILFAFTSYRIHSLFFAFLSNYFMVPLSIVPSLWIMTAELDRESLKQLFLSKQFSMAVLIIILTAISDGYYAFFALLLLGFATLFRSLRAGVKLEALAAPMILISIMFVTVLSLQAPILLFRQHHPIEANQDQMKQATDAEVYAPSIKLLIAPIPDHRINRVAELGRKLISTANFNRKYPYTGGAPAPLGTIGTFLLLGAFFLILIRPALHPVNSHQDGFPSEPVSFGDADLLWCIAVLSIVVLLCTIQGGIGSLIAFVYPAIRAYERFSLFLIFLLYLGFGVFVSRLMRGASKSKNLWLSCLMLLVTVGGIFDQVPKDILGLSTAVGRSARSAVFLSERQFVHNVEAILGPGEMVYQYPFSQYLSNNRYYGWGSFAQLRLYLHSASLRWSNGAAKGSPIDKWHERLSFLPLNQIIPEISSVGFRGIVVDRGVLSTTEYNAAREVLNREVGPAEIEDDVAKLSFWKVPDPGYRIGYDKNYVEPDTIWIFRSLDVSRGQAFSRFIRMAPLAKLLSGQSRFPLKFEARSHPEIFAEKRAFELGMGQEKVPFAEMIGDILCPDSGQEAEQERSILLTVRNRSSFDWKFNSGEFPIRIGVHLYNLDGSVLQPDGLSVATDAYVRSGESVQIRFPLTKLYESAGSKQFIASFVLMQDGNAWFAQGQNLECTFKGNRSP